MCDNDTQKDVEEYLRRHPEMTRRDFTKLATGAGLAMMFPPMVNGDGPHLQNVHGFIMRDGEFNIQGIMSDMIFYLAYCLQEL